MAGAEARRRHPGKSSPAFLLLLPDTATALHTFFLYSPFAVKSFPFREKTGSFGHHNLCLPPERLLFKNADLGSGQINHLIRSGWHVFFMAGVNQVKQSAY